MLLAFLEIKCGQRVIHRQKAYPFPLITFGWPSSMVADARLTCAAEAFVALK
jgi:hypothetical protein